MDNRLKSIHAIPPVVLRSMGLGWYIGPEAEDYLSEELLQIKPSEISAYQEAATELVLMYEMAAKHVIERGRYQELGIPENAIELIELSWQRRTQSPMLYGRFDLVGGIDGEQVKLIEFNADTATILPETVRIQVEQLKENKLDPSKQFNELHDDLVRNLKQLREGHSQREPYFLLSTMGFEEDRLNAEIIATAAEEAGFQVQHMKLENVTFSPEEGLFTELGQEEFYEHFFWFKLVPWEFIAYEEPELMEILTEMARRDLVVMINPAYTMLYQSKAMMKILWELFPNHKLLLKTSDRAEDFAGQPYVEKVIFGREGENINIVGSGGDSLEANDGDFGEYPNIYQQFVELPKDSEDNYYQAGLYFTDRPSALSFRREDGLIIDEDAEFVGHLID